MIFTSLRVHLQKHFIAEYMCLNVFRVAPSRSPVNDGVDDGEAMNYTEGYTYVHREYILHDAETISVDVAEMVIFRWNPNICCSITQLRYYTGEMTKNKILFVAMTDTFDNFDVSIVADGKYFASRRYGGK